MKRAIAALFAAALVNGAASHAFASSAVTYIGLYADPGRTAWCAGCPSFCPIAIYAWVLPSDRGAQAVEFDVSYPVNVIPGAKNVNCEEINCIILIIDPFYSYVFRDCQSGWVWVWRQDVYLTSPAVSQANIVPAPGLPQISYASCEADFPVYPMIPLNAFHFNWCPIAVEEETWGKIKALFR